MTDDDVQVEPDRGFCFSHTALLIDSQLQVCYKPIHRLHSYARPARVSRR